MAIFADKLGYLIDPAFQIESVAGKPLVGGHAEVFLAGTQTKYITCQDWDGNSNPFKIPLKNDGRAVILAEVELHYDLYVYDSYGNLAFSRLNIQPKMGGSIEIDADKFTRIRNTDDTLAISVSGGSDDMYNDYIINSHHTPLGVETPLYFDEDQEDAVVIALSGSAIPEVQELSADVAELSASLSGYEPKIDYGYDTSGRIVSINSSAIGGTGEGGAEYSAGANINITDHVISGKDWSTAIESATSGKQPAFSPQQMSAISSISGKQDQLTPEQLSAISSVSSKQDKLTDEQLSAISSVSSKQDKLTDEQLSAISSVSSLAEDILDEAEDRENADMALSAAISGKQDKLTDYDPDTWNTVTGKQDELDFGYDASGKIISINTSAIGGTGGSTYSAGANIDITDGTIAVKNEVTLTGTSKAGAPASGTLSNSAFTYTSQAGDSTVMSNTGIDVTVFSGDKLSLNTSGVSGSYPGTNGTRSWYVGANGVSGSYGDNSFSYASGGFLVAPNTTGGPMVSANGNGISATVGNAGTSPSASFNFTGFNAAYSGAGEASVSYGGIWFTSAGTTYRLTDLTAKQDTLTFGYNSDNEISSINNSAIAGGSGVEYSAGSNINITDHVISGKDWTNNIESATSGKQDKLSDEQLSAISSVSGISADLDDKQDKLSDDQLSAISSVSSIAADVTGKQDKLTDKQLSAISSVSGKQDTLTFGYDSNSAISSINSSAIGGTGALTGLHHDETLSGEGTTGSLLGVVNEIVSAGNHMSIVEDGSYVVFNAVGLQDAITFTYAEV